MTSKCWHHRQNVIQVATDTMNGIINTPKDHAYKSLLSINSGGIRDRQFGILGKYWVMLEGRNGVKLLLSIIVSWLRNVSDFNC